MRILAHRGLWRAPAEKNTLDSFSNAWAEGFGIETDLRDARGQLVISHDPPVEETIAADEFFALLTKLDTNQLPLALNVKSDGLQNLIMGLINHYSVKEYFCFDMTAPETVVYRRVGLRFFTRESEYESVPVLYSDAAGIWLDMFTRDWITPAIIIRHLEAGKEVAIVSPELHKRPHLSFWQKLRNAGLSNQAKLMLCTDHPVEAREFFS